MTPSEKLKRVDEHTTQNLGRLIAYDFSKETVLYELETQFVIHDVIWEENSCYFINGSYRSSEKEGVSSFNFRTLGKTK